MLVGLTFDVNVGFDDEDDGVNVGLDEFVVRGEGDLLAFCIVLLLELLDLRDNDSSKNADFEEALVEVVSVAVAGEEVTEADDGDEATADLTTPSKGLTVSVFRICGCPCEVATDPGTEVVSDDDTFAVDGNEDDGVNLVTHSAGSTESVLTSRGGPDAAAFVGVDAGVGIADTVVVGVNVFGGVCSAAGVMTLKDFRLWPTFGGYFALLEDADEDNEAVATTAEEVVSVVASWGGGNFTALSEVQQDLGLIGVVVAVDGDADPDEATVATGEDDVVAGVGSVGGGVGSGDDAKVFEVGSDHESKEIV
ncbi:hypothetical protein BGZ83_006170 [Gryganskiella cystojenkinii]|nr:hypothetical protein BGZ83_006170 [Gryganskiella cystojenkinii]